MTGAVPEEIAQLARPLDPAMVATIAHMRSVSLESLPDPDFVQHLETKLMEIHAHAMAMSTAFPGLPRSIDRRLATAMPRQEPRWWPALAVATVLLVVLGAVAAVRMLDWRDAGPSRGAPAILTPGTPAPDGTADRTLLEVTLPAENIPHTTNREMGLSQETFAPGATASWVPYCCNGVVIQYQLTGTLQVRAAAPIQIVRAGGIPEDIAADVEATVNQGDALIVLNQIAIETTNAGSKPADVLVWVLLDDPAKSFNGRTGQAGVSGQHVLDSANDEMGSLVDFPESVTVLIQRRAIAADEQVDTPAGSNMLALTLDSSTESIIRAGDGSYIKASNTKGEPATTVYIITASPGNGSTVSAPAT